MSAKTNDVTRVRMHATGPDFSSVIWGSMRMQSQFDSHADLVAHLSWLADRGVTTLDTAAVYGAPDPFTVEELLGKAVAEAGRDKFEIVTKCGIRRVSPVRPENRVRHFDFSAEEIRSSTERSLQKLGIDEIDLMLLHRPDYLMDPAEVADTLDSLVAEGKIRRVGVSNFSPSRLELLTKHLKAPVVTNQVEFSPIFLKPISDGIFDTAMARGHKPMIWSPIGGGRLMTSEDADVVKMRTKLSEIAEKYDLDGPAEAAIAFVARHPVGGVPIVGSGRKDRMEGAIKAMNTELDKQDWYDIVATSTPSLSL